MKTFEEIQDQIRKAQQAADVDGLFALAGELDELGTQQASAVASMVRAVVATRSFDHAAAYAHLQHALEIYTALDDRKKIAQALYELGANHMRTGDYPSAIEYLKRALEIQEQVDDQVGLNSTHGVLGVAYFDSGNYAHALDAFRTFLEGSIALNLSRNVRTAKMNIANVYGEVGDVESALDYFYQFIRDCEVAGDDYGLASGYYNLGAFYEYQLNNEEALRHYERSAEIVSRLGDPRIASMANLGMAAALVGLGRIDEAEHAASLVDPAVLISGGERVAVTCLNAAILVARDRLDEAEGLLLDHMEHWIDADMKAFVVRGYSLLRDIAQKRNDLPAYIEYNTKSTTLREEISGKQTALLIATQNQELELQKERAERDKERALLYGALPEHIATRMLAGETIEDHFESAAVLFADIVGFTTHTSAMHPSDTIKLLEDLFSHYDAISAEHGVVKVKTIGDAYLCFKGDAGGSGNALAAAQVALALQRAEFTWPSGEPLTIRIGIHSGPVSAGVIGTQNLQYDIWGDTVNVASRMESSGEAGRIQVSSPFATALRDGERISDIGEDGPISDPRYPMLRERGAIEIKGKGAMQTYWLEGA